MICDTTASLCLATLAVLWCTMLFISSIERATSPLKKHMFHGRIFLYFSFLYVIRCMCCAQTTDRDNPWIALPKVWIRVCATIHGLSAQSMDRANEGLEVWISVKPLMHGRSWEVADSTEASPLKHLRQQCCSTWLPIRSLILASKYGILRQQGWDE